MADERFTMEDAVLCCQKATQGRYLGDVDLTRHRVNTECPCEINRARVEKKLFIQLDGGWFNCPHCHAKGKTPVSLFMHITGMTDATAAAREMHKLLGHDGQKSTYIAPKPVADPKPKPKAFELASIEVRDHTYRTLLSLLTLSLAHRGALLARGLTGEQIDFLGYRSLPRDRKAICKKLLQLGCVLEGVPGFFKDKNGDWTMNFFGTGILIPWRNAKGQIQFLQIRKDKTEAFCKNCKRLMKDGTCKLTGKEVKEDATCDSYKEYGMRYFTLSSPDKECGSAANTWVHARKGWLTDDWKEVIITEGALKADVASCISGCNFLAVAGVTNIGDLPRALRDLYLAGLEKVCICYDNEPDNEAVIDGEESIKEMLELIRIPCEKITWTKLGLKGVDDWLKDFKGL